MDNDGREQKSPGEIRCSFCGKPSDGVKKLISGPGVYICDECVALAIAIITEDREPRTPFRVAVRHEDGSTDEVQVQTDGERSNVAGWCQHCGTLLAGYAVRRCIHCGRPWRFQPETGG